uniref:C-C motif chemokine n=1 Tax=Pygocentrus nattereri TaxID=42514 RepID=A0A3B4BQ90_PYGNA
MKIHRNSLDLFLLRCTEGSNVPGKCCFKFIKVQIPMKFIISFSKTNSNCPKEAIIFHTVAGMEWCANPKAPWVQESIKKLTKPGNSQDAVCSLWKKL